MKKLILLIAICFCSLSGGFSQSTIKDLSDFVELAKMPLEDLKTQLTINDWYVAKSRKEVEGETVSYKYAFSISYEYYDHKLLRVENSNVSLTSLMFTNEELLQGIKEQLSTLRFKYEKTIRNKLIYSIGNNGLFLTEKAERGYYRIDFFNYL